MLKNCVYLNIWNPELFSLILLFQINKIFERKIMNIFLSISFDICFECSMRHNNVLVEKQLCTLIQGSVILQDGTATEYQIL